jgi:hypothetical protein
MKKNIFSSGNLMEIAKYVYTIPYALRKLYKRPRTFRFLGKEYPYLEHPYNLTWKNERAIELPIIWDYVKMHSSHKVLEVGNVLAHYFAISHTVIDKYENQKGVIAEDIVDVKLKQKYSCIVSISTLEHVGWDEVPRVLGKHFQALEKLRSFLEPNGQLIITIPLGFNPPLDNDIFNGKLGCNNVYYFKRIGVEEWREASLDEVRNSRFGSPYRSTNGLAICYWKI